MDPVLGLALAGGAVALAVKSGPNAVTSPAPGKSGASKVPLAVSLIRAKSQTATGVKNPTTAGRASTFLNTRTGGSYPTDIEAAVVKKAKAEFDKLSAAAKKAACQDLKASFPNDPGIAKLDCNAPSYDQVMKAIAAAGATAACAATGAGAVVSPLCGLAGAWIAGWAGPKVKEWAEDAYDAVSDKVGGAIEDTWHAITPW